MVACLSLSAAVFAEETQKSANQLFEDISVQAGIKQEDGNGGVCFADLNNDGRPDAIINGGKIFLNEGGKRFARIQVDSMLTPDDKANPPVPGHGTAVGDVNNDGNLDFFATFLIDLANKDFKDHGRRNELWLGDGKGGFVLRKDTGLSTDPQTTITACFFDYDGDGNLDLFVGNWFVKPWQGWEAMVSPLYRGHGDGTFEDVTEKAGLLGEAEAGKRASRKPVFCAAHTDWNNDGFQDLLIGTYAGKWNALWRNNGDGTFTDAGRETGFDCDIHGRTYVFGSADSPYGNTCTFEAAVADYDCDGDMDCYQATIRHWDNRVYDPSMMLVNKGKDAGFAFRRELLLVPRPAPQINAENWGDLHAGWLDADNDGWQDLVVASSDYPDEQVLKLFRQIPDGSGAFEDWTPRLGFRWVNASNISFADFDRDGATDIMVSRNHMRLTPEQVKAYPLETGLFRNLECRRSGNGFLNIRLKGQALGARVTVVTGNHRQIREVYGCLGIGSHRDDSDCRFGIGAARIADRVEVRWPDRPNTVQTFEKVEPNRFYVLSKGGKLEEVKQ